MLNTKTSEVQATLEAQQKLQQLCNEATIELHVTFSYEDIKHSLQNALLGWISDSNIEQTYDLERFAIFDFFQRLSNHLEFMETFHEKDKKLEASIENYSIFLQSNRKKINTHFDTVMYAFLLSAVADDRDIRGDVVYHIGEIQKYVNKIFKIQRKTNPETSIKVF